MDHLEVQFADTAVYDPDAVDTFNKYKGKMLWCSHCERAYPYGWYRPVKFEYPSNAESREYHYCPYDGCNGDVVIGVWTWAKVRQESGYPAWPEIGKRYPLDP